MSSDSFVILGVPIDNLDLEESLSHLFGMVKAYDKDGRPRTAVAVNAETVMHLRASRQSRPDDETGGCENNNSGDLMNTARNADLMIPIGLPVAWASRILGFKLKKRISAPELFHHFLETAASTGKTALLIQKCAPEKTLPETNALYTWLFLTRPDESPITGDAAPKDSEPDNRAPGRATTKTVPLESMAEEISSAGIDFLIIDISDPGLAMWFEGSKNRIHVPVRLLISGNREILQAAAKNRSTRPNPGEGISSPLQKAFSSGLLLRLNYRHILLILLVFPLVIYQKYNQAVFNFRHQPSTLPAVKSAVPKTARGLSIRIISMPDPLDASVAEDIRLRIRKMSQIAPKIILDFSRVNFMDSSGLGLIMGICRASSAENREVFLAGVKPKTHYFFKLTKTIDFFENRIMNSVFDVVETVKQRIAAASFYYLALIRSNAVVFHFYGKLDAAEVMDINAETLMDQASGKDVILNLADLDFIDSAGIRLLVKIHRHVSGSGCILIACGMKGSVRRLFSIIGVDRLFTMENSLPSAELALRRHQLRRAASTGKNADQVAASS